MSGLSDLRLSKNMKYTALYWAMRFEETIPDLFIKKYNNGLTASIKADYQEVSFSDEIHFKLDSHKSFVLLELMDRILSLGYKIDSLMLKDDKLLFNGYTINCFVWDDKITYPKCNNNINYKSRLVSGVLEYESKITVNNNHYDYGIFEEYNNISLSKKKDNIFTDNNFIYDGNRLLKYCGKDKKVYIPKGTEEIESSAFWDNLFIEEVIVPESVINYGGDTFYNCKNLKKINIPKNVRVMGNNPFGGCVEVEVSNESPNFIYENGILYNKDKTAIIYCSVKGKERQLEISEGVKIIGKHAFYLCDRFERLVLPSTIVKMENNPFSGCSKLELISKSNSYIIKDDVIYNGFKTSVVGTLNKIKSKRLVLPEGTKTINRNSFWNCKGIECIVLPSSLEDIGYNPFVGCSNIHFESKSNKFKVIDDVLYNADCSKIICYPAWKAIGEISLPDSVITIERGAFSGCNNMTKINLHNVNIINKSCFTNCIKLKSIYCSDLIKYIGEWAFAYCVDLTEISVNKDTIIDNNALSNTNAKLIKREKLENYLIESDNLYTLKSMQSNYKNKIDSICIDPPYNSHIDYIGYKDGNYNEGYLNFMKERIELSYNLLSKEGFLIINIDEGEVNELENLCKEIFILGEVFVNRWKKKNVLFDKNRVVLNPNKKQTDYEYIIVCKKSKDSILGKVYQPILEGDKFKEEITEFPECFDNYGTTSSAKDEIKELFGTREYFSTPKPVKLIKEFIRATTKKDSIVMDFFAGSGTTGHAVFELNKEDGGNRIFILINNKESNICEDVTKKRLNIINVNYRYLA